MNKNDYELKEIKSIFDKFSKQYNNASDTPLQQFLKKRFKDVIKNYSQGRNIIEIGCGTGILLEYIHGIKDWDIVVGLDISRKMLLQVDRTKSNQLLVQADGLHHIPFKSGLFNTVVCVYGPLSYTNNIDSALKELIRVLKYDGTLIGSVTSKYRYDRLAEMPFESGYLGPTMKISWINQKMGLQAYNTLEIKRLLENYFEKYELFGIGFVPIIGKDIPNLSLDELINLETEYQSIPPFIDIGLEIGFAGQTKIH